MKLTEIEFQKIRPLKWKLKRVAGIVYHTLENSIDTSLFWYDFLRLVFAPKFASQEGVQKITNFDTKQPVLLSQSMNLLLPNDMEKAMYYANNKSSLPFRFEIPFNQLTIIIITTLLFILLMAIRYFYGNKLPVYNIL